MQVLILIRLTKDYLHMNLHVIIHSFSIVPPILQKSSMRVTYVRLWLGIPCVIYTKLRGMTLWESTTWETGEHSLVSHSMSEIKHCKSFSCTCTICFDTLCFKKEECTLCWNCVSVHCRMLKFDYTLFCRCFIERIWKIWWWNLTGK